MKTFSAVPLRKASATVKTCFEKIFAQKKFKFLDFFTALKVFEELNLINIDCEKGFKVLPIKDVKKNLTDSKLYNKLSLIKNIGRE